MGLEGFGQGGEGRTRSWLASPWRFGRYLGRRLPGPGGPRGIPGWPQAARSGGVRDAAQPGQGELPPPLPWPAGGQVRQAGAVFEVADGGFDLGVATVVGLQLQGAAGPVGDERVVAIVAEQG